MNAPSSIHRFVGPTDVRRFASADTIEHIQIVVDDLREFIVHRVRSSGDAGCSVDEIIDAIGIPRRFFAVVRDKMNVLLREKSLSKDRERGLYFYEETSLT
ncbi:hypothetical protein K8942_02945 [Candidatus Peribacteria bacterium]|nr:MAG: hypothetical protein K8942_02945 [Candidatus Peribacteria bacterium]